MRQRYIINTHLPPSQVDDKDSINMRKILLLSVLFLLSLLSVYADKLYVKSMQATDDNSLQNILLYANSGDTILFNIQNAISSVLELSSELTIKKSITINGINTYNGDTIIIRQNGEYSRILIIEGSNNIINLENLKLTKGTRGCIYIGENNTLNLSYCHIYSNFSYYEYPLTFGGIYADKNSVLTLTNCLMQDNRGYDACSIYGYYSSINIKNTSFSKDYADAHSITLEGGNLTIEDCHIYNNIKGIKLTYADMTMRRCFITNNSHTGNAWGGGICAFAGTNVYIEDSEISNNLAGEGAGIWAIENLTILNSIISNNQSTTDVGGISFGGKKLLIDNCLIENNKGYNRAGGIGIYNIDNNDSVIINNTTINNNEVTNSILPCFCEGGGINAIGPFILSNSTVSNNKARNGAGIAYFSYLGNLSLINNTFYNNTAKEKGGGMHMILGYGYGHGIGSPMAGFPKVEFISNTVAKNEAQEGGGLYFEPNNYPYNEGYGTISMFNNLIVLNNNGDFEKNDIIDEAITYVNGKSNIGLFKGSLNNDNVEFLPYDSSTDLFQNNYPILSDNGGFTKTIALSNTSIAIGKGVQYIDGFEIPILDQRGYYRNNPPCIGAFEYDGNLSNNKVLKEISSNVYSVYSSIVITNLSTYSQITIFDMNGRLLFKRDTQDYQINIPMKKGVYIVKINDNYHKVIVY